MIKGYDYYQKKPKKFEKNKKDYVQRNYKTFFGKTDLFLHYHATRKNGV